MTGYVTIRENRDFRRAYSRGKYYVSPILVTYVVKNRSGLLRTGITTSKKTGNAVRRSRSRRVIRAAFRPLSGRVAGGCDLVFVARARTPMAKSQQVRRAMERHLKAAGVLR
ncbi:MAG TPA: ribonuclease P protein component [Ruminococcaceae bacterium]|nr:ribonuclease P protein component [Oscillospiraceae bacterium]HBQ46054.1 ribonuclease P protein component [Oscillospiraceae bacterium]HBT91635.1 ribonuclease P protein component [Oscillospiraceae bacterium]HCB90456.1 ribonuclease P protein component [Oscillospiraceae bacterium]